MSENQLATHVHAWTPDPLSAEVKLSLQKLAGEDDVRHLAIMPDVHLAHEVCVGTVLATSQMIYPSAVGGDIGCGMAAIRVTAQADLLRDEESAARLLAGLYQRVPSNRHTSATLPEALPAELLDAPLSNVRLEKMKQRDGRVQFGTLGRGNHFLEFQSDPDHHLWVLVHSGSRAMGQAITLQHVESAPRSRSGLASFNADDQAGQRYLQDVAWAIRYAQLSRLAMLAAVESLLQQLFGVRFDGSSLLHSQHNHVQRETHFDRALWVHRKGAQSARLDEPGIIPGSMGTSSFHVSGRGQPESLCSSSHGAGRRWSRSEARRNITARKLEQAMGHVWFDRRKRSLLRDEAPAAYKDIHAVMRAQRKLTRIVRELRPLLIYKLKL